VLLSLSWFRLLLSRLVEHFPAQHGAVAGITQLHAGEFRRVAGGDADGAVVLGDGNVFAGINGYRVSRVDFLRYHKWIRQVPYAPQDNGHRGQPQSGCLLIR